MEVILLADVYKHGVAGEVVSVANGFARNYLIPKGLAVQATSSELKRAHKLREKAAERRKDYEEMLNDLGRKIDGTELIFFRRAASTGKLFGSVTTMEIADSLMEETGVDINRRRISQQPLRDAGTHEVPVRLGTDVSPVLQITIVPEDQRQEFLKAREAAAAGEQDAVYFDEYGNVLAPEVVEAMQEFEEQQPEGAAPIAEVVVEAAPPADDEDDVPAASDFVDEDDE